MENQTSLQQQQFAEQMQKVSAERQSQVENATKSEGGKIKRENASKEKQGKSQHNSQMKPSDSDDSDTTTKTDAETDIQIDPVRGHIIDIKT
ncbi:MAG TPA: hypothetical protein PKA28_01025 [Methylomusa anaerophila]|nr:hypothetical protein [Methylomusa anaerophila]